MDFDLYRWLVCKMMGQEIAFHTLYYIKVANVVDRCLHKTFIADRKRRFST